MKTCWFVTQGSFMDRYLRDAFGEMDRRSRMQDSREISTSFHRDGEGQDAPIVMKLTHRPSGKSVEVRGSVGEGYADVKQRALQELEVAMLPPPQLLVGGGYSMPDIARLAKKG